jgi:hypothetical protein
MGSRYWQASGSLIEQAAGVLLSVKSIRILLDWLLLACNQLVAGAVLDAVHGRGSLGYLRVADRGG